MAKIVNLNVVLAIPTGTPINEENAKIETPPLTAQMKIRKSSK